MKRLLAFVITLAACGPHLTYFVGAPRWFEEDRSGKAALAKRASFDLDCPEASLQYQQVGSSWVTVGVTGCSHRSTYVYDYDRSAWIMNTETHAVANER